MKLSLMKPGIRLSAATRLYIGLTIFIVIPMLVVTFYKGEVVYRSLINAKEQQLTAVARQLAHEIPGSYEQILIASGRLELTGEDRVIILNEQLQQAVNHLGKYYPDYGMGYFDLASQQVVAIGPNFSKDFLISFPLDHSFLSYVNTHQIEFLKHPTSIGWKGDPIVAVTYPLFSHGELIGHTWANVRIDDILLEVQKTREDLYFITLFLVCLGLFGTYYMINLNRKGLKTFVSMVIFDEMDEVDYGQFPELRKLAQEVVAARTETLITQQRFLKIFTYNPIAMSVTTTIDGRYVDVNRQWEELTGFLREEAIGRTVEDLDSLTFTRSNLPLDEVYNQVGLKNQELTIITKTGEYKEVLYTTEEIRVGGNQCFLHTLADITELKKLKREMTRIDQLNLVAQMAAGIGHEIRNPMTTVRGFLQLMRDKDKGTLNTGYYDLMIEELDRANSIISEFLSLTKENGYDLQKGSLNDIIRMIYPLLMADAFTNNINIEMDLGDIPDLLLNDKEIRQLIFNLVRNGMEAMPEGGKILIQTEENGEEVIFVVKDEGQGIHPDVLAKLGTPFFTTKDKGTGLGLAVCYSIAERHNAVLEIYSNGKGTKVVVRFKKQ